VGHELGVDELHLAVLADEEALLPQLLVSCGKHLCHAFTAQHMQIEATKTKIFTLEGNASLL
jgi:hypothetical protein